MNLGSMITLIEETRKGLLKLRGGVHTGEEVHEIIRVMLDAWTRHDSQEMIDHFLRKPVSYLTVASADLAFEINSDSTGGKRRRIYQGQEMSGHIVDKMHDLFPDVDPMLVFGAMLLAADTVHGIDQRTMSGTNEDAPLKDTLSEVIEGTSFEELIASTQKQYEVWERLDREKLEEDGDYDFDA